MSELPPNISPTGRADGYVQVVRGERIILTDCADVWIIGCNRVRVQHSLHVVVEDSREVGGNRNTNQVPTAPILAEMLGIIEPPSTA